MEDEVNVTASENETIKTATEAAETETIEETTQSEALEETPQNEEEVLEPEGKKRKKKRVKKPLTKGRKIARAIILSVVGVIVTFILVLAIMFGPFAVKMLKIYSKSDYTKVDTELTREQRLADLDYMYKIACIDSPSKELYEQAYGISYEDVYNIYRSYVEDCESEIEYFGYMACFLSVIPGQHNYMYLPDYEQYAVGGQFSLIEEYGNQELKDYSYSYKEDFRDDVEMYLNYNVIGFAYVDGQYIGIKFSSALDNSVDDYDKGILISIDGKDPNDMCFDFLSTYAPSYDCGHDCFYRERLVFNDGIGTKHVAEILMPDGTVSTVDLYEDPAFFSAIFDGYGTYRDLFPNYTNPEETEETESEDSEAAAPSSYVIYADAERKLVYVNTLECDASEGESLATDLKAALAEADADTVIIDTRNNIGGSSRYATAYLLPVVFSHDVHLLSTSHGTKNDYTKKFYSSPFYKLIIGTFNDYPIRTDDKNFYYAEDMSVTGLAEKEYKIYVLTGQGAFSSGDALVYLCKEYGDAVLVGGNTGGEGICGVIFNCTLPESHFMFTYMGSVSDVYPEDGVYGVQPDIYVPYTYDEYYYQRDMKLKGEDPTTYECRLEWDKTLQYVLGLAEND